LVAALVVELSGEAFPEKLLLVLLPAAILALAAVKAANIARESANERQERQLRDAALRNQQQLQQATERQDKELRQATEQQRDALTQDREMREEDRQHDREIRAVERARDALDAAVVSLTDYHQKARLYVARLEVAADNRPEREREESEAATDEARDEVDEIRAREIRENRERNEHQFTARIQVEADYSRLLLRFDPADDIPETQKAAMEALIMVTEYVNGEHQVGRDANDLEKAELKGLGQEAWDAVSAFQIACRAWDAS
jgi:hypothetical protein